MTWLKDVSSEGPEGNTKALVMYRVQGPQNVFFRRTIYDTAIVQLGPDEGAAFLLSITPRGARYHQVSERANSRRSPLFFWPSSHKRDSTAHACMPCNVKTLRPRGASCILASLRILY
ncbi:hypothetical protein PoB_002430300 [Plakobranchus ocellatus]|uniref:Uncharacterized protein n=1 Tax=Plakobranchus ocellatus TaxID=259542 RepID=A0AAV3ZTK3_9GAST|nr:hypothetical protein PoB_002430300 [Plakobranchus ocellatus]